MARGSSSFERFLSSSSSEVSADEETLKRMNLEINDLRLALKAANDSLLDEKQQKVKDRKVYEAKIKEMKTFCNDYFVKLSSEHDAKLKSLEVQYEINLKKLQCQPGCRCQLTSSAPVHLIDKSVQSEPSFVVGQSVQTEVITSVSRGQQTEECKSAEYDALQQEVGQLKKKVAELVFMNNRYHFALSNCTLCEADDLSDASTLDEPIRASTPLDQDNIKAELSPSTSLLSSTAEDKKRKAETIKKSKDKAFITRMVRSLGKLEKKYQTPPHKRKPRLFKRKQVKCTIVPKEFSSIYEHLASRGPDESTISPMLIPQVSWHNVKFKPVLPSPEECAVYSCSEDPDFYKEKTDCFHIRYNLFHKKNPFGSLLGYKTTLGTVPVPTEPIGGYVYCTELKRWILHATPPTADRGLKGGGRGRSPSKRRNG